MMSPARVLAPAIVSATVAVLLSGCGGGGGSSDASGGATFGSAEFGLDDAELNGRIDAMEASIATCMSDAGFEYVAVDAATVRAAMNADGTKPGVSDADFVAQYGFGISTILDDPVKDAGRGEQNAATYAALPDADKVAYDRALVGEAGEPLARALENEDFSSTGGCTLDAVKTQFTGDELTGSYINPADVAIAQDKRIVKAIEEWSACMSDQGYSYQNPEDLTDELTQRFAAIVGQSDPTTLTGAEAEALTALQGEERALAVAATDCEEQHIAPVQEVVEAEIYGAPAP